MEILKNVCFINSRGVIIKYRKRPNQIGFDLFLVFYNFFCFLILKNLQIIVWMTNIILGEMHPNPLGVKSQNLLESYIYTKHRLKHIRANAQHAYHLQTDTETYPDNKIWAYYHFFWFILCPILAPFFFYCHKIIAHKKISSDSY